MQEYLGIPAGWREDGWNPEPADASAPHEVTAIVNVADDAWMHGVRIAPDLDSCMYTLGGGADADRGWGRADETWSCSEELRAYGVRPDWFGLGDRDLATHLIRTQMLSAGYPLSDVTAALCNRWKPGARLLPVTDDRCETHVVVDIDGERRAIHFQEWWVGHRAALPTHSFTQVGAENAAPAPGVLDAIENADLVLIAPSNPVVSVGAVLSVPGIRGALRTTAAPVVGVSPVIGGAPLRGMADICCAVEGIACTAAGIGAHYGPRAGTGLLDGWLVAEEDACEIPGVAVAAVPLLMSSPAETAAMVHAAASLVGVAP